MASPWSLPGGLGIVHVVALGLVLRLTHLAFVAPTPMFDYHRTFVDSDMYIFDQWARRIVGGDPLGRQPFHYVAQWERHHAPEEKWATWFGRTPVFYKAPAYAYLVALLYWVFGDPMLPLAALQILASVLAIVLLLRVTEQLVGRPAGLAAALFLAVYAPAIHFDVTMLRGTWIAVTSLAVTWRSLAVRSQPSGSNALFLGLSVGAALLFNEAFAPAVFLVAGLFFVSARQRLFVLLAGYAAGLALALLPVVVRNHLVGAPLFQWAVLGGVAFAICNTAGASPYFFEPRPDKYVPVIEASGGSLLATALGCLRSFDGPLDVMLFYLKRTAGLIVPYENPDNVNFYYAALHSPILGALPGWAVLFPAVVVGLGLAVRRLRDLAPLLPAGLPLLGALLLTLPMSRYRTVLAVFLMPAAGLALARAAVWVRERKPVPALAVAFVAMAIAVGTQLLQTKLVFGGQPEGGFLYRPVEFLLSAQVYESRGRLADAAREALDVARLNPDRRLKASALAVLGRLQGRQGNAVAAKEALAGARLLGAGDPYLLVEVAGIQADVLADKAEARATYGLAVQSADSEAHRASIRERLRRLEAAPGAQ
ncbi:MAG: glycosyltransferase family 39 protein [Acidobacteria bacterium]|nr:glycosyltransferase family 39 protein [Acidobacteriota bacterium]